MSYTLDKFKSADLRDLKDVKEEAQDGRPDWDSWFMSLCFILAQRSLDKHTKHGCVIVDKFRSVLSVGYNGPPRGCIDLAIPLYRPAKYNYFQHAEANAITNAARCGTSLFGSTFYVTGPSCPMCFGKIINVGACKLIYGPILHKRTPDQINAIKIMKMNHNIKIVELNDTSSVVDILMNTKKYIDFKNLSQGEENLNAEKKS